MKKIIILLVIAFSMQLASCSEIIQMPVLTPAPSEAAEETVAPVIQELHDNERKQIIVNVDSFESELKDPESGAYTIFNYYVENPVVNIESDLDVSNNINQQISRVNKKYLPDSDAVGVEMDYYTYLQSMAEDNYMLKKESEADLSMYSTFSRTVECKAYDNEYFVMKFYNLLDMYLLEQSSEIYVFDLKTGELVPDFDESQIEPDKFDDIGSINIETLRDTTDSISVPVCDLISVNDEGNEYLLMVSGTLDNVKISEVGYFEGQFIDISTIWYCNFISDAAIQIKTLIDPDNPNIKISYDTSEGEKSSIISSNMQTGEIMLMLEDAYNAVG